MDHDALKRGWRVGVEVELLAPPGRSRRDLAELLAGRISGGSFERFFHPQSEPSEVPGRPVFHNLTLGYRVLDQKGRWVASCVDDLTLQHDLIRSAPPCPGWYRIASDDRRLLYLTLEHADPCAPVNEVLQPLARMFGTAPVEGPGGMVKVNDRTGASVAIAAPLPGERERPCELVTAPLRSEDLLPLEDYLEAARRLGFTAPREGATHLHFDAAPFQNTRAFSALVLALAEQGERLKSSLGYNPHCRRLGAWPQGLVSLVSEPSYLELSWEEASSRALATGLSKYCDYNLLNVVDGRTELNTVEVRVLPVHLEAAPILEAVNEILGVLRSALAGASRP